MAFAEAHHVSGLRRGYDAILRAVEISEATPALPEDGSKGRLRYSLERGCRLVGLTFQESRFLRTLVSLTSEQDWTGRYSPICWASNDRLEQELGLGRTQIQTYARRLIAKGWLGVRDSANGKRWGKRSADGEIRDAAGFDLSPLAHRFGELQDAISAEGVAQAERRRLKTKLGCIRREIRTLCSDGLEKWPNERRLAESLVSARGRAARSPSLEDLVRAVAEAEVELAGLRKVWKELEKQKDSEPRGSGNRAHKEPTTYPSISNSNTYMAFRERVESGSDRPALPADMADAVGEAHEPISLTLATTALEGLCHFAPVRVEEIDWTDLHEAADLAAASLGISPLALRIAREIMGRRRAAVAVGVVLARRSAGLIESSAGGYLRALTEREKEGALNLMPTLYGLRDKALAARRRE